MFAKFITCPYLLGQSLVTFCLWDFCVIFPSSSVCFCLYSILQLLARISEDSDHRKSGKTPLSMCVFIILLRTTQF